MDLAPALKFIFLHENKKTFDSIEMIFWGSSGRKLFENWTVLDRRQLR